MKFEEQFPSLKTNTFIGHLIPKNSRDVWFVPRKDVWEHCLDKQRVRDTLKEILAEWSNTGVAEYVIGDAIKRLGLEDMK